VYAFAVRVSDSACQVTEKPFEMVVGAASGTSITGVVPPQIPVRSGDTLVTVSGVGFAAGSVVTLEGASLTTTFVSATSLTASCPHRRSPPRAPVGCRSPMRCWAAG
jgi:hypothetical protein